MKITSAYANKMIRALEDEKSYILGKEESSILYTAAVDETPVIPEYDYEETSAAIAAIDEKICRIKHALNMSNITARIPVNGREMSVDMILVRMSQLNKRKSTLNDMRRELPKTRVESGRYSPKKSVPEYQYTNYDIDKVKEDYEKISEEIMQMQMALDRYNQTEMFEADI